MGTIDLWFRRRYGLTLNDPRYLEATEEQIVTDYWAQHYEDRRLAGKPEEEEFEDDDFDLDEVDSAMRDGGENWLDVLDDRGR